MRVEIKCAHPFAKRKDYGPGWMCETDRGGCGATGSGDKGHYNPVLAYADIECPNCTPQPEIVEGAV